MADDGTDAGRPRAGWYDDPSGQADLRWWDGQRWTEHTDRTAAATPDPSRQRPRALLVIGLVVGLPVAALALFAGFCWVLLSGLGGV